MNARDTRPEGVPVLIRSSTMFSPKVLCTKVLPKSSKCLMGKDCLDWDLGDLRSVGGKHLQIAINRAKNGNGLPKSNVN